LTRGRINSEYTWVLFPLAPRPKLIGIARLADRSPLLQSKSRVEYFELPTRSLLNRCSNREMPFTWTINPYRGCEFGCKYCYARYTHEFMGMEDGRLFERKIYSKRDAAAILRRELSRHPKGAIAIGTSTDPYQPAERKFRTTRSILQVFAEHEGLSLSITTKSNLVERDVDLLRDIHARNDLSINMTVTTADAALARQVEPFAPRPDLRFEAVGRLAVAGLRVGIFANPIMPLVTDSFSNLDAVASAAAAAGATYFGGGTLFLMPSAQKHFYPFLEEHDASLVDRYKARFARDPYLRGHYAEWIRKRVNRVRARHRLASSPAPTTMHAEEGVSGRQLPLFGEKDLGYPQRLRCDTRGSRD